MILKESLKKIYYKYSSKLIPNLSKELEKAVGSSKTLLDVGCGSDSPIKPFSAKLFCVGVDAYEPSIKKSQEAKIHNKYFKMNVLDIDKQFKPNSFDCVVALDLIEHFTKEEGLRLLELCEQIAKNKVIIFTPNGFLPQAEYDNNPLQEHKSGWTVEEMEKRGYQVIGIHGSKKFRGDLGDIKFKPRFFWRLVSDISQLFVRNSPQKAFQILCIKNKK